MDTAKRILYGITGCFYLMAVVAAVGGFLLLSYFGPSMAETQKAPTPSAQAALLTVIWLLTGILLLLASVLRPRWLAKPKQAAIILCFGCMLLVLPLLPGVLMPRQKFGSYTVIGIICFASFAHDAWICVRRDKQSVGN
jgi:O-antigen/teichoic acid export membrane protein